MNKADKANKGNNIANKQHGAISFISLVGIIAIILLIASIYLYTKKDIISPNPLDPGNNGTSTGQNNGSNTSDPTRYAQKCGIKILYPTIGATVSFPLTVKGQVYNGYNQDDGANAKPTCTWTKFEGQAGTAEVLANINNQGWKSVGYWDNNGSGQGGSRTPVMLIGEWMQDTKPNDFSTTLLLDPKVGTIPAGTPMKIRFVEEDPSGMGGEDILEVPIVYSGENAEQMTLTLYFPYINHPTDCGATVQVKKTIPKTLAVADASMRILLDEAIPQLKPFYNGVTIKNKVAIVDFDKGALTYLDGAACMQQSVKSPIEKTLNQYPTIDRVDYSIDGVVKTDWDA